MKITVKIGKNFQRMSVSDNTTAEDVGRIIAHVEACPACAQLIRARAEKKRI